MSSTDPTQSGTPADNSAASGGNISISTTNSNSPTSATGPGDITITERFISDSAWPADLKLDLGKSNWDDWSHRMRLLVDHLGFTDWLDGTLPCPDQTSYAKANRVWKSNDRSLRAFMLERISKNEFKLTQSVPTSHSVFEKLRSRHEHLSLHSQVLLLKKALDIRANPDTPLSTTIVEIDDLHTKIMNMGAIDGDRLRSVLLINCLNNHYTDIQSSIHAMADDLSFSSETVVRHLEAEEALLRRRNELSPGNTALAAMSGKSRAPKLLCANCKRTNHTTDFCISTGGKMAGRSIEDARNAQRAFLGRPPRSDTPKPSSTTSSTPATTTAAPATTAAVASSSDAPPKTFSIGGLTYSLVTTPTPTAALMATISAEDDAALTGGDLADFDDSEFALTHGEILESHISYFASVDWNISQATVDETVAYSASLTAVVRPDLPFVFDSGATCHISPERSNFRTLVNITPHPIKGVGGSCIYATGKGSIDLRIAGDHTLSLHDVLYVPKSTVRLVSVRSLNRDSKYITHFDTDDFWVTEKGTNNTIARGTVSPSSNLFILPIISPHSSPHDSAFVTKPVPDIHSWHLKLGHCNYQTVVDMAKNKVTGGMPIDLSYLPPKCDFCILGKQTRASIPKTREGIKATKCLERVHVDLCGPMSTMSKAGNCYSMNIIDDFSSYVWSLPLKKKSDAAQAFQQWQLKVENNSERRLKILVSDNGKLLSQSMQDWCSKRGIDHQLTAPHASAQNGRAKRLHRTLNGKARAMCLACNAPTSLWDEFNATAALLTNVTGSVTIGGKTPSELWFGRPPSLTNLREIGCKAFALIPTHNPKLLQRSCPCILIGYAPRSKAYRLWDPASGKVFNSIHVTFVEHQEAQPQDLLPGTLLNVDDLPPPTWDAPGYPEPSQPCPIPLTLPSPPILDGISATFPSPDSAPPPDNTPPPPPPLPPPTPPPLPPPPSDSLPPAPPPPPPPPRRSKRSRIPTSRGIAHNTRLTNAISNSKELVERLRAERNTRRLPSHNEALTFLTTYSAIRESHDLFPLEIYPEDPSLDITDIIAALADGSATPTADTNDDPSWTKALASSEREYWIAGARDELRSLADMKVFILVPRSELPSGKRPLKGKLVCRRKRDDTGNVTRYKVRYVAKGYAQQYSIDYDKTTAPTARIESFRIILHLAANLDWDLQQLDIKTTFLHGILPEEETMYMEQPPGFASPGQEDWVMKLMKSIYGMKQAGRIWNQTFNKVVESLGFKRLPCEWCVYMRQSSTGTVIFAVHVDDILCAASSIDKNAHFKAELKAHWDITDLGPANFALGIAITRDRTSRTISISQTAFIDRLLVRFNQVDSHPSDTPMIAGLQLQRPPKSIPTSPEVTE